MSWGAPLDRSWRFGPGVIFEEGVGFGVGKRVTAQGGVRATPQQLTTDPARQPHGRPRGSRAHADAPHAQPRQLGDGRTSGACKHVQGARYLPDEGCYGVRVLDARHKDAFGAGLQVRPTPPNRLRKAFIGIPDLPPVNVGPGVDHQRHSGLPASLDGRPNPLRLFLQLNKHRGVAITEGAQAARWFGIPRVLEVQPDGAAPDYRQSRLR